MKRIGPFLFSFVLLAASAPAVADTVNCSPITKLPKAITKSGVYCLKKNLSTSITSGNAIIINASDVVLDLNGFQLNGLGAGPGTQAMGIYANQRQSITIKNGTVRGFYGGIYIDDDSHSTSQGHVIEGIRAEQNTNFGLNIKAKKSVVRGNLVVSTGGSTNVPADAGASCGIVIEGSDGRVLDNDVADVAASGNFGAVGIALFNAPNSVVAGNRVSNVTAVSGITGGIFLEDGSSDVVVSDNRLSGVTNGISFGGSPAATGTYMNNLVQGATTPYTGGTPAGSTNY